MTEAYHRARRLFALFSGILIAWEYIGIEVGDEATGATTAKLPVADTTITLRNPEVIPLIMFILVLYFAFRFSIEWAQCPKDVRYHRVSVIDAVISYLIGLSAVVLFGLQRMSGFRLAETLTMTDLGVAMTFSVVYLSLCAIVDIRSSSRKRTIIVNFGILLTLAIIFLIVGIFVPSILRSWPIFVFMSFGFFLFYPVTWLIRVSHYH